jgi:hypothetical protein
MYQQTGFSHLAGKWRESIARLSLSAMLVAVPLASFAQSPPTPDPSLLIVPTTKVLAIGSFTAKGTPAVWLPMVADEARRTADLYFQGKIDQWYIKTDKTGVVFLMNVTDIAEAQRLLGNLPMGKAGVMAFQTIPLGPISPLRMIISAEK